MARSAHIKLLAWQDAMKLAEMVYQYTKHEATVFDQITRVAQLVVALRKSIRTRTT